MTLTREQILEKIARQKRGYDASKKDAPKELATVDKEFYETLCQMALNSLPRPFNPEDKGTWPESGEVLFYKNGKFAGYGYISEGNEEGTIQEWKQLKITHYLPIPEVEG